MEHNKQCKKCRKYLPYYGGKEKKENLGEKKKEIRTICVWKVA
jgi:hypothetical protein